LSRDDLQIKLNNADVTYSSGMFYGGYVKCPIASNAKQETISRIIFYGHSDANPRFGFASGVGIDTTGHYGAMVAVGLAGSVVRTCISDDGDPHYEVFETTTAASECTREYVSPTIGNYDYTVDNAFEFRLGLIQEGGAETLARVELFINGNMMLRTEYFEDEVNGVWALFQGELRPFIQISATKSVWMTYMGVYRQ
jgi:hypothetical protein